jgi:hemolysin III
MDITTNEDGKLTLEDISNTITHGFGLILCVVGFFVLLGLSISNGGFYRIFSSVIYGLSLVVLYAASTLYHSTTSVKRKEQYRILDHICIYLLIAGSYTPFMLIVMREGFGFQMFGFVWLFAAASIVLKLVFTTRFPIMSVVLYLLFGWLGVFMIEPLYTALGLTPILLILAGGLSYSFGVIFFAWEKLPHNHAIWHIFVLGGSIFHFVVIAGWVVPYSLSN